MTAPSPLSRRCLLLLGLGCALPLTGCGYHFGSGIDDRIRTVHVPTFTSDSFRRDYAVRLTEAVHRQIGMQTPYRLVTGGQPADTRLIGHVTQVDKSVISETRFDDARELQMLLAVNMRWEDTRTGRVLSERIVPIGPAGTDLIAIAPFSPETGQSRGTAEHAALDDLAREIVAQMERPW